MCTQRSPAQPLTNLPLNPAQPLTNLPLPQISTPRDLAKLRIAHISALPSPSLPWSNASSPLCMTSNAHRTPAAGRSQTSLGTLGHSQATAGRRCHPLPIEDQPVCGHVHAHEHMTVHGRGYGRGYVRGYIRGCVRGRWARACAWACEEDPNPNLSLTYP